MEYKKLGLVNTKKMFKDALVGHYAIPAFNFYNMETLNAVLSAADETQSPVILAVSESALDYMGDDILVGMISGKKIKQKKQIALHLDHGHSFEACVRAIKIGFSSVMIDASKLPFAQNVKLTKRVVDYAHKYGVCVEAELGVLGGYEDKSTKSKESLFTRPEDVIEFVKKTNVDSLAISIGTSHGVYKRKSETEKLQFDILAEIAKKLPNFPLVLHGASNIPQKFVTEINKFGGKIKNARGIPASQLKRAVTMNICKINVDSDSRLAFTASVRKTLAKNPEKFNPREYLQAAMDAIQKNCSNEIKNIMGSANKLKQKNTLRKTQGILI